MRPLVPEELEDYESFLKRYFPHAWPVKQARGEFDGQGRVKVKAKAKKGKC